MRAIVIGAPVKRSPPDAPAVIGTPAKAVVAVSTPATTPTALRMPTPPHWPASLIEAGSTMTSRTDGTLLRVGTAATAVDLHPSWPQGCSVVLATSRNPTSGWFPPCGRGALS